MTQRVIPPFTSFGRVPRLPVDVLSHTVLQDSAVTNYDKYVECLASDVKEAMVIAQGHASKERKRHTQLYNRKVKGSNSALGQKAVKKKGKKKLADRGESTMCSPSSGGHYPRDAHIQDLQHSCWTGEGDPQEPAHAGQYPPCGGHM